MLVLTRKPNERIIIDNNIVVTVVGVGPERVKIGIEAPANVRIDRQEVAERMAASEPQRIRCPECRNPGEVCDRCNGEGYVPLAMLGWIQQGRRLRALRLHHPGGPLKLEEAAARLKITVDEYSRQERGCVQPATV